MAILVGIGGISAITDPPIGLLTLLSILSALTPAGYGSTRTSDSLDTFEKVSLSAFGIETVWRDTVNKLAVEIF